MPSQLHESLIDMFRARPVLVAELLSGPLGVPVPPFEWAGLSSADMTDIRPAEFRADAVITLKAGAEPVLMVVVEVQLTKDRRKKRTWPVYVATLHARWDCRVTLLVVCPDPKVAAWCAEPMVFGDPGLVLTPVVLGPGAVPVVTDPGQARANPEMAVLSALAHGSQGRGGVLEALLAALEAIDLERADLYAEMVFQALQGEARHRLEELMTTTSERFQGPLAQRLMARGEARGRADGEARAVLAVLEARGMDVPDDARARILGCTDLDVLDAWVRRAVTVDKVDDLLD